MISKGCSQRHHERCREELRCDCRCHPYTTAINHNAILMKPDSNSVFMKKLLIIPDCHANYAYDNNRFEALGNFIVDERPNAIINIGDFADMASLCSYDFGTASFEGRRYKKDIESVIDAQERLFAPIVRYNKTAKTLYLPQLEMLIGNHECFAEENSEILTDFGFKKFADLTLDSKVATVTDSGKLEWNNPIAIHKYDYDGEMFSLTSSKIRGLVTPNHRMWVKRVISKTPKWELTEIQDFKNVRYRFLTGAYSGLDEQGIEKDWLSLTGWILTDATYKSYDITIYQSEGDKCNAIRDLLNKLHITFTESIRDRQPKFIAGRPVKNKCRKAHEFHINAESSRRIKEIIPDRNHLPLWVWHLSDQEALFLVEALIDGDGSRHKKGGARMFYGRQPLMNEIHAFIVTHGMSASIVEYRPHQWRLNITLDIEHTPDNSRRSDSCNIIRDLVEYKGRVWCLTVPNEKFIVKCYGRVWVSGNSRITKATESDPKLDGTLSIDDLQYKNYGWRVHPFLVPVVVGGISFSHYFISGIANRPISGEAIGRTMCLKLHASAVQGHSHVFDLAERTVITGKRIFGLSCGCFVHPDYNEEWCVAIQRLWWRGVVMLEDLDGEGYYDSIKCYTQRKLLREYL